MCLTNIYSTLCITKFTNNFLSEVASNRGGETRKLNFSNYRKWIGGNTRVSRIEVENSFLLARRDWRAASIVREAGERCVISNVLDSLTPSSVTRHFLSLPLVRDTFPRRQFILWKFLLDSEIIIFNKQYRFDFQTITRHVRRNKAIIALKSGLSLVPLFENESRDWMQLTVAREALAVARKRQGEGVEGCSFRETVDNN